MEIDGYIFCLGINSLKLAYKDCPDLQNLIRPITYLIRRTAPRPTNSIRVPCKFSLDIRSLGELLDMYHTREASDRRDKVYALLGMSSDDCSLNLSPDYNVSWHALFQQVIKLILCKHVSAMTWENREMAIIKSKGCTLGQISSIETNAAWDDRQNIVISKFTSKHLGQKEDWNGRWTLQTAAKPIRKGDIICLLQGALKPTIIRLHANYFTIIAIAVNPINDKNGWGRKDNDWSEIFQSITDFSRNFLLVWDWTPSLDYSENKEDNNYLNSQASKHEKAVFEMHSDKTAWLMDAGLILGDLQNYTKALQNVEEAMHNYKREFGDEHSSTITAMTNLAAICKKSGHDQKGDKLGVIADILGQKGDYNRITEKGVMNLVRSFDEDVMGCLLDQRRAHITITEYIVKAAAENLKNGNKVMKLLLYRRGGQVTITKDATTAIAANFDEQVMAVLLDRQEDQIAITEDFLKAAARNYRFSKEVMALLLNQRGHQISITEGVVKAAASNYRNGKEVMALLLNRPRDQIAITEDIIKAAVRNPGNGKEVIALLLNQGSQITLTEDIVKAAAGNFNGKEAMKFLLSQRSGQVNITRNAIRCIAAKFDEEVMVLLLNQQRNRTNIMYDVVKAARGNWNSFKGIIASLFNCDRDRITITEDIVKAAAGNQYGKGVMALLLGRHGDQVTITEEVIKAAAGNPHGKEVITLLLDLKGDQITITEEVIKAAAENPNGKEILTVLLNRRGGQFIITKDIIKSAAGNKNGKQVLTLLLSRRRDQITITEDIVEAAATCGQEKVLDLLSRQKSNISDWDGWLRISKFYNAAENGDVHCIQELLGKVGNPDMKDMRGQTPLWIAAANGREEVVEALIRTKKVDVNSKSTSGKSPLFLASGRGYYRVVDILIKAGADPSFVDEDGNTAIIMARQNRYEQVARLLEKRR